MKIACVIKPRADGTVKFVFAGKDYVFRRDADGLLACDVGEQEAARAMLATDRFYPQQQEDEALAQSLVQDTPAAAAEQAAPRRAARRKKDVAGPTKTSCPMCCRCCPACLRRVWSARLCARRSSCAARRGCGASGRTRCRLRARVNTTLSFRRARRRNTWRA